MKELRKILQELARNNGWESEVALTTIVDNWSSIVGISASRIAKPIRISDDNKLLVQCNQSVWVSELTLRKLELVKKINSRLGSSLIMDIVFKI